MTVISPLKRAGLLVFSATLLCNTNAAMAQSAEDHGLGGLLQALFAPTRPAIQPQPAAPSFQSEQAMPYRQGAARLQPRIRYAALPKSEPLQLHIGDRQTPISMSSGATAALLKDPTLRPGDIVVLKDGARVFTGNEDRKHTLRDFEPVNRSAMVDRKTRVLLSMMIAPAGALPPDEVRKFMARLKASTPSVNPPAEGPVQTLSMRVITP